MRTNFLGKLAPLVARTACCLSHALGQSRVVWLLLASRFDGFLLCVTRRVVRGNFGLRLKDHPQHSSASVVLKEGFVRDSKDDFIGRG
jgi:hypothetical protein